MRTTKPTFPSITQLRILEFLSENGEQKIFDIPSKVVVSGVLGWKALSILVSNELISERCDRKAPVGRTYYKVTENGLKLLNVIAELEKLYDGSRKT